MAPFAIATGAKHVFCTQEPLCVQLGVVPVTEHCNVILPQYPTAQGTVITASSEKLVRAKGGVNGPEFTPVGKDGWSHVIGTQL